MDKNNNQLYKYAGMATQFLIGIGLTVYGGIWVDKWLKLSIPLAVWLLPLLFITGVIVMIIRDTNKKKQK